MGHLLSGCLQKCSRSTALINTSDANRTNSMNCLNCNIGNWMQSLFELSPMVIWSWIEVFTLPGLIHMESISNSMWNLWNECWLGPQPIHCSLDIMDSIWNDHRVVMEWSIPYGIHHYSTWIPLGSSAS